MLLAESRHTPTLDSADSPQCLPDVLGKAQPRRELTITEQPDFRISVEDGVSNDLPNHASILINNGESRISAVIGGLMDGSFWHCYWPLPNLRNKPGSVCRVFVPDFLDFCSCTIGKETPS